MAFPLYRFSIFPLTWMLQVLPQGNEFLEMLPLLWLPCTVTWTFAAHGNFFCSSLRSSYHSVKCDIQKNIYLRLLFPYNVSSQPLRNSNIISRYTTLWSWSSGPLCSREKAQKTVEILPMHILLRCIWLNQLVLIPKFHMAWQLTISKVDIQRHFRKLKGGKEGTISYSRFNVDLIIFTRDHSRWQDINTLLQDGLRKIEYMYQGTKVSYSTTMRVLFTLLHTRGFHLEKKIFYSFGFGSITVEELKRDISRV